MSHSLLDKMDRSCNKIQKHVMEAGGWQWDFNSNWSTRAISLVQQQEQLQMQDCPEFLEILYEVDYKKNYGKWFIPFLYLNWLWVHPGGGWVANIRTDWESVESIHFYSAVILLKTFKLVIHIKQTFNDWPHSSHTWNHITTWLKLAVLGCFFYDYLLYIVIEGCLP